MSKIDTHSSLFEVERPFKYPSTRFQGSKRKLLPELEVEFNRLKFETCIDLFSGSGSVSFLLRKLGKNVIANDFLKYNQNTAKVFLTDYSSSEINGSIELIPDLLNSSPINGRRLVERNFKNIFFTNAENREIDNFCQNVDLVYLDPPYIPAKGFATDYSDFYGFLEGLVDYELFDVGDTSIAHKPVSLLPSAWAKKQSAEKELRELITYWKNRHILLSYRGDGAFGIGELREIFEQCGRNFEVKTLSSYKYALAHSSDSSEILVVSTV